MIYISSEAMLVTVYVLVPISFFLLMKCAISHTILAIYGLTVTHILAIILRTEDSQLDGLARGSLATYLNFRFVEICALPQSLVCKWNFNQYVYFMFTRDPMLPSVFGKKNPLMHRYEHVKSAVSIIWYQSKRIIAHVIMYILARAYLEKYPQMASSWIIAPWNLSEMMHQLAFGCLVYSTLQLPSIPYTMFVALAFKTPCIPMFIRPYFSTSLREFWSYRWNNHFQSSFKKTVFLPVLNALEGNAARKQERDDGKPLQNISVQRLCIASMATFFVSGVYHEVMVLTMMDALSLGSNFVFFIIHGLLVLGQIALQNSTGWGKSWGKNQAGVLTGWFATMLLLLITSPLFSRPYEQSGLLFRVPIDPKIIETVKAMF